jgi:hypothetical protein
MKIKLKTLLLGLSAAALLGTSAPASTLHIAGSTAFRVAATHAIIDALIAQGGNGTTVSAAYVGTGAASEANLFGAAFAIFKSSAGDVVKTAWTGSSAGVIDLTEGHALTFLKDSTTVSPLTIVNGTTSTSAQSGTVTTSADLTDVVAPEAAFSDAYYTSVASATSTQGATGTGFANDILNASITPAGTSATAATDRIGIVPFAWWQSKTNTIPPATAITNITQQVAYELTQSPIPVTFLNGDVNAKNDFVYCIGRNEDSGTRILSLVETQGVVLASNSTSAFADTCKQFSPTFSNGNASQDALNNATGGSGSSVTGINLFPANNPLYSESPVTWGVAGHSGFVGGGDVKNVLLATNPNSGLVFGANAKPAGGENSGKAYLMGCLGWSDGYGISSSPLNYNGVTPSAANIANGTYSLYCYEHFYYLQGGQANQVVSPGNQDIADKIADLVVSTYAPTDGTGNYASTSYPQASSTVLANTDRLLATDGKAPAGIILDSNILVKRTIEGGAYKLSY